MVRLAGLLCLLWLALVGCGAQEEQFADEFEDAEEAEELPQVVLPTTNPAETLPSPLCHDDAPGLITDLQGRRPPSLAEPDARVPFRDPTFGSCLVRVTDRQADRRPDDESPGRKNEYARVQSFNADESLIMVYGTEGEWFLYDALSLQPLGQVPIGSEPRWDAKDPNLLYYVDETGLFSYNLTFGEQSLVHDFANVLPGLSPAAVWTRYEGRPSRDTRYWGFFAEDDEWLPAAFVVYDRVEDRVAVRDVRGLPGIEDDVDHVTMSPLGTYFLASFDRYCGDGSLGDDAHPCGLMVYDRDLGNGRSLLRTVGHYDPALDAHGREVIVYQSIDTDEIAMLDLESGMVTPLWTIDFSHTPIGFHFSGLAYDRPGWALVSTYSGGYPDAFTWMDDQVFAVELVSGGRVVRLAHTHSRVDEEQEHDYWAEPHATVNRDFTRVLFTTNWGRSGSQGVDMYLVELAADWSVTLP